jgi:phage FluMu protein Com
MVNKVAVSPTGKDIRCLCGRLTARLEKRGVVVKCHRCGELVVFPLSKFKKYLTCPSSDSVK